MSNPELIKTEGKKTTYLIDDKDKIISVCAYCRVSTDSNDQRNSFESQKHFFENQFKRHNNWISKTVFADKGISGTSLKKRDEFNRMISLAKQGKYSLIITKEVSRFSRNVKDILNIVTELHDRKIYIWFLTDDIYTEDSDYREKLIKAGEQAESESRRTSKRVRWGQGQQMEKGIVFGRKEMYGYNIKRDESGKQYFEIIPDEAEIVRQVFEMYAGGMGTFKIAKKLEENGITTKRLKNGWSNTAILRMLRNERYVGDLLTGKTYTPDCLTHEKKYNRGESDKYIFTNHHPETAIITRGLWNTVQALLKTNTLTDEQKSKHSNRYWCSGKVVCGECGERYVSHLKKLVGGGTYKAWKCFNSQKYGSKKTITLDTGQQKVIGCNSESVNEKVLRQGVYDLINQFIKPNTECIKQSLKNEYKVILNKKSQAGGKYRLIELEEQQNKLNNAISVMTFKLASGEISQKAYDGAMLMADKQLQDITDEIKRCSDGTVNLEKLQLEYMQKCNEIDRMINLEDDEFNDELFSGIVERIEVCQNHIIKFKFYICPNVIDMKYSASGRLENYKVDFIDL